MQVLCRAEQRPAFWEPAPARHISQHLPQLLAHLDMDLDEASDLTDVEGASNTRELPPQKLKTLEWDTWTS